MKKELKRMILRRGRVEKIHSKRSIPSVRGAARRYGDDLEEWPEREGNRVTRRHKQGDDLGPLVRYLEANVGRPWDVVFSEMVPAMRGAGVDAWHLRLHVRGAVDTSGKWAQSRYGRAGSPRGLYVDANGILQNKPYHYRSADYKTPVMSGDLRYPYKRIKDKVYVNDDGWKLVTVTYVKRPFTAVYVPFYIERSNPCKLVFGHAHPYRTSDCGRFILRPKLKTLSRQEIKALGL